MLHNLKLARSCNSSARSEQDACCCAHQSPPTHGLDQPSPQTLCPCLALSHQQHFTSQHLPHPADRHNARPFCAAAPVPWLTPSPPPKPQHLCVCAARPAGYQCTLSRHKHTSAASLGNLHWQASRHHDTLLLRKLHLSNRRLPPAGNYLQPWLKSWQKRVKATTPTAKPCVE